MNSCRHSIDRSPAEGSAELVLPTGDVEIFRLVYQHRLLRIDHLNALTGRSARRLHRRLFRLRDKGYLTSIRLPQQKHIYALGLKAVPLLVEHGIAEPALLAERLRTHELKELFLKHELMIVDVHVALACATRGGKLKLHGWREGKDLFDSVTVFDHAGAVKLPIRPDAFFALQESEPDTRQIHYFLEADRSTMSQARLTDKLRAYWHYLEQGLHVNKHGIKSFRVVTVTVTEARAANLCTLAAGFLPERARKYFLFTSLDRFSGENKTAVLGRVYVSPRDGGASLHPLIPETAIGSVPGSGSATRLSRSNHLQ
jgi:hypothetical protein